MRTKIILCLFVSFCLIPNILLSSQKLENNSDGVEEWNWSVYDRMLYNARGLFTTRWMPTSRNNTNYLIKIMCYSGMPYMGEVYLDIDVSQPASKKVNYGDREYIVGIDNYFKRNHERISYLSAQISKFNVSFKDAQAVSMYIVDALTGDTVVGHSFPKPPTKMDTLLIGYDGLDTLGEAMFRKLYAEAIVEGNYIAREEALATSSLDYVLPQGLYFVYFINTDDRKLRWAEQITINE